jgi:DNA ligase D-like protein (predicted ligase)
MQAVSAEAPFSSHEYVFEVKWDGLRAVAFVEPERKVRIQDRGLHDITDLLPELQALAKQAPAGSVLDGEVVATDAEGRPDYHLLRRRLAGGAALADAVPVAFLAFDALFLEGRPQLRQPWRRRRARLGKAVEGGGHVFVPDYIEKDGVELFEACLERGLEGVMAKHMESTYVPGQRSPFWLKVKAVKSDDFVITGWTESDRGRPFGALLVGYYEGGQLLPCGSVGGGFDDEAMRVLEDSLPELESREPTLFPAPVMQAPVRWCRPELVISVRYSEWTPEGTLRFPIFNGLRPEVHPAECIRHRPRVVLAGRTQPGSLAYDLTRFPF